MTRVAVALLVGYFAIAVSGVSYTKLNRAEVRRKLRNSGDLSSIVKSLEERELLPEGSSVNGYDMIRAIEHAIMQYDELKQESAVEEADKQRQLSHRKKRESSGQPKFGEGKGSGVGNFIEEENEKGKGPKPPPKKDEGEGWHKPKPKGEDGSDK